MSPRWVRWSRGYRRWQLRRHQHIEQVGAEGWQTVRDALSQGGVMIVANHSAHYDSTSLYVAADEQGIPVYFMTAWQVFAMSKRWQRWLMRRIGCFSIDRESNDRQAYRWGVEILRRGDAPLVIFPEGDIFHSTDRLLPFREGAAAIALSARKKSPRPLHVIPCGIKFRYLEDPTPALHATLDRLDQRLHLRNGGELALPERIHRVAEAALSLREIDYLGRASAGPIRTRMSALSESVLSNIERRQGIESDGRATPERVRRLRQRAIAHLESLGEPSARRPWERDLEDLFFVTQLYSYRGDYLDDDPPLERLAETIDKLEEDVLDQPLPSVKGRRRADIRFGPPLPVDAEPRGRQAVAELTRQMQQAVQEQIDNLTISPNVT